MTTSFLNMDHVIAGAVLVGWPLHDTFLMWPPLLHAFESKDEQQIKKSRIRAYCLAIGMPWATLAGVYCASQMGRLSGTPTDFLLSQPALPKVMSYRTMATAGLCTIATIDTWTPLILALTGSGDMELHQKNIESASFNCFWPSSPSELLGWVGVSVTAGVAEEILFRGFLPHYLLTYCNVSSVALAHAISAVLFGAGHLYARTSSDAGILSNWKGALGSMIIGGMFSLVALQTNSIRIPIVCHALIDVGVGAFAYTVRQQRKTIKKVD